jgi:hypothetical protein
MYYVSPFTYLVQGMLAVGVANTKVVCSDYELLRFSAPSGTQCGTYMEPWVKFAGGYLKDNNTSDCEFCSVSDTNTFLAGVSANYSDRWRNFGIMFIYIFFNIFAACFLYWLVRVPKKTAKTQELAEAPEPTKDLSRKSQESFDTPVAPVEKSTEFGSDGAASSSPSQRENKNNEFGSNLEPIKTGPSHPTKHTGTEAVESAPVSRPLTATNEIQLDEKKPL